MDHAGKALIDPYPIFSAIGLSGGQRVADLGCGRTGHFVFPASRVVGDSGIVYAIDVMKDILENIKSRARTEGYDNVQTAWADVERPGGVPTPPGTLDACFMINVLFLLRSRTAAVAEMARLLKKGGVAVIVDWAKRLGPLGPLPEHMLNPRAVVELFAGSPFIFKQELKAGEYHFALIFERT